ncbi:MAG TPA: NUDIX hydrolase [Patescibacteria group bacterium]|nr:NUDIX hydrolase [Patescibacteria group bacterium]
MQQYQQSVVGGFILNDKKEVLLVKRSNTDDFLPGLWELPGGGTDFGEHPIKALERELREEVGLEVIVEKPLHVDDYFMENKDEKIHRVEISFLCTLVNKEQEIILSHEHQAYQWVAEQDVEKFELTDYMKKTITNCFENI